MREDIMRRILVCCVSVLVLPLAVRADVKPATASDWLLATAFAIPKETTNHGTGYFSLVTGKNGRLYVGAAKYGVGASLVEFDPGTREMKIVCETHKAIGTTATGFAAQSKIHTRNNVGWPGQTPLGVRAGTRHSPARGSGSSDDSAVWQGLLEFRTSRVGHAGTILEHNDSQPIERLKLGHSGIRHPKANDANLPYLHSASADGDLLAFAGGVTDRIRRARGQAAR
jgi:hypothetical protein